MKNLNTTKQLCAGHKIADPVMKFFEYTDNVNIRKMKFTEIERNSFHTELIQDFLKEVN